MGKIRRRNRRGNRNHLPPAPVNPQIVTETHLWCRAPCKLWFADVVGIWHLISSCTSVIYKNRDLQNAVAPRIYTAMKVKNVWENMHKAKEHVPIYHFFFLPGPLSLHIWYLLCAEKSLVAHGTWLSS